MASLNYAGIQAATYNAITGRSVRYAVWPALTGAGAVPGVKLTDGTGAWGALADIVAAKAIATDFWICGGLVNTASGAQVFEIEVQNAAKAVLASWIINPTAVTLDLGVLPVPFPIYMAANSQVQGRVGGAGAKSLYLSISYATLL